MTDPVDLLPDAERRLHRAILLGMIAKGGIPSPDALAAAAGLPVGDVPARLQTLARADYLALDVAGRVRCLYPFSPAPTPHVVVLGHERRFAMCSIDALGVAAMLGRVVTIEGSCARCGEVIRLDVEPGAIRRAEPPAAVVVARRSGVEPACDVCCPFTRFACGPAHGAELAAAMPETEMVPLAEALPHAETTFGGLLAEALPARRRRSALTTGRSRT
jgi:hypothetical protein